MIDVSIFRGIALNKIQPAFLKLNPNNKFSSKIYFMFEPEEIRVNSPSDDFLILNSSNIIHYLFQIEDIITLKYVGAVQEVVLYGKTI